MTIIEQIQEKYPFLTRKQREVATYMVSDPERMSYVTLKEISKDTGITEMTILKTCDSLGFSSFSDLKYEFRKYAAQQMEQLRRFGEFGMNPAPDYELSDTERLLKDICSEEARLSERFFNGLDVQQVFAAADILRGADKVVFCGRGVSTYVCEYLSMLLSVMGFGSVLINTELYDSIHMALPMLTPKTVLFVVSFPDYYHMTTTVAEFAHRKKVKVIAMTDSDKSPVVPFADMIFTVPTTTRMFMNTLGVPMMLANLIASALNIRMSGKNTDFAPSITEFYALVDKN